MCWVAEKHVSTVLKEDTRLFFCIYVQSIPSVTPLCRLMKTIANRGDGGDGGDGSESTFNDER